MQRETLHTVIFDWAGTTLDKGSMAPILALLEAFRRYGIEITVEEARGPMGIKKDEHVRAILALPSVIERFENKHLRSPSESDAVQIYAALEPIIDEVVLDRTALIPGHWELVLWLRQRNLQIGSTTGYTRNTMSTVLALAAKQGYQPDCCITPSEARGGRPAPWMIWQNLEQLGCDAAWRCIKIGDTEVDMEEGRRAGCWCIGYTHCGNLHDLDPALARDLLLNAGAHFVVEGPWQVKEIVQEIEAMMAEGERP